MAITDITKPMALDETLQGTNTKMDAVILKLQGIIDALGLDTSVYKPKGNITCAALVPALLIDDNLGNVYNVTDNGTTTSDFVEGAGKPIHVGDNVAIVDIGTGGQSEYKFDLLAGMVDLTNYVQKSATPGLLKNDGTVDTKDYAEKVASATNGNLAGLNSSGNPTDSGISGDMTTTSASGNPISITDLKSAQIALNPVITFEPIQAGSGTPSPSNIRAISGYDKIEVLSCGFNIWDEEWEVGGINSVGGANNNSITNRIRSKNYIKVFGGTTIYIKNGGNGTVYAFLYDTNKEYLSQYPAINNTTYTLPQNCGYIRICPTTEYGATYGKNICINISDTNKNGQYEPYHKTTDLSESLGQTVYWLTHTVRTGIAKILGQLLVNPQNLDWHEGARTVFYAPLTSGVGNGWSSHYAFSNLPYQTMDDLTWYTNNNYIYVRNTNYNGNIPGFVASLNDVQFVYPLATPTEIQLTPHEIALSQGYNYISTNGTSISLAYHNGEVATHADVEQLGETVNKGLEFWKTEDSWQIFNSTQLGVSGVTLYAHGAMRILIFNQAPTGSSEGLITTLPAEHRPSQDVGAMALIQNGSEWRTGMVTALPSGKVTSIVFTPNTSTLSYANNMTVYRSQIVYYV